MRKNIRGRFRVSVESIRLEPSTLTRRFTAPSPSGRGCRAAKRRVRVEGLRSLMSLTARPPRQLSIHAFAGHVHVALDRILVYQWMRAARLAVFQGMDLVGQAIILPARDQKYIGAGLCCDISKAIDGRLP